MNNKIKVCHITSVHHRSDTRIRKFCGSLIKVNYEVILLCADQLPDEVVDGLQIHSISFSPKNKMERILYSSKHLFLEAMSVNADIYHIHDPELLPLVSKLKRNGKKVIYDSHEDFPQQIKEKTFIPYGMKGFASWLTEKYMKNVLKNADAVISVSPHIVDKLTAYNPTTFLITNYPVFPDKIIKFDINDYVNRSNQLCYAGTVYEKSNQETIINALEDVSFSISYKLVGSIEQTYKEMLQKLPAFAKVDYTPPVSKMEVEKIYANSTIGILVYNYCDEMGGRIGTFGSNKIFEYMLAGLPVIFTDFTLWKPIVGEYHCGICVPPQDKNAVKNAIEYMIKNKEEAFQMGQNGRRAVMEKYNWETQEKEYLERIKIIANN